MSHSTEPADIRETEQAQPVYKRGPFRGLTPDVIRLGLVSFFADVSGEMLYPITPIFLTAALGAPVAAVGLTEGVAEAAAQLRRPLPVGGPTVPSGSS